MRFRPRHVHQTVVQFVETQLDDLGWVTPPINFGTTTVVVDSAEPDFGQTTLPDGNLVGISMGDEPPNWEEELGGAVESVNFVVFLDVIGATESVAVSIAADLKELLRNKVLTLQDFTLSVDSPSPTTHFIEFESVMVETPTATVMDRRRWRVVKVTAHTVFSGSGVIINATVIPATVGVSTT